MGIETPNATAHKNRQSDNQTKIDLKPLHKPTLSKNKSVQNVNGFINLLAQPQMKRKQTLGLGGILSQNFTNKNPEQRPMGKDNYVSVNKRRDLE